MLDDPLGRASVQYSDWRGTVAMDNADHVMGQSITELAKAVLGDRVDSYLVMAFDVSVFHIPSGGGKQSTHVTLYLADREEWNATVVSQSSDPVKVLKVSVPDPPQIDKFLFDYSKRFSMRLELRAINSDGARLEVVGDLDDLENFDPEDFL